MTNTLEVIIDEPDEYRIVLPSTEIGARSVTIDDEALELADSELILEEGILRLDLPKGVQWTVESDGNVSDVSAYKPN